ncbi:MAG: asparagine synthase (glutamine-hydrolyzing) [Bdellovibrionaceae bacterium]|nr:asparagine synthase (glutamine-hydrolyzing) [Pseudobdellovibrionaceae bacterium]
MCGIFGAIEKSNQGLSDLKIELLQKSIQHRGPDGNGFYKFNNFAVFGNVRLAIVDRSLGQQPIFDDTGDWGIVYNGEVYNHSELRERLIAKGWSFKTKSDTEVVLKHFIASGVDGIKDLNGMFSFCIWNIKKNEYFIARDRLGIKPLYIYEDVGRFIFSSELKTIAQYPGVNLELNPLGIQDNLYFRYNPAPHTIYKNVTKLDPGTYLHFKGTNYTRWPFWNVSNHGPFKKFESEAEAVRELDVLLEKAIKSQLMGEVPVGVLLSGGLDSSTISYYIHKFGQDLKTFNIGFKELNEFEFSRAVAKKFGLQHYELETSVDELIANYEGILESIDEPIADPACFPLFILAKELKKHVTVVLSGEGGDELFGGYNQYVNILKKFDASTTVDDRYNAFIENSFYFTDVNHYMNQKMLPKDYLRFKKYFYEAPILSMNIYDLVTWMPDNLMMKADKTLMYHSLEGRFPFLDNDLLDFSFRLPEKMKINDSLITKYILRKLVEPNLPKSVLERPKMGFSVPVPELLTKLGDRVNTAFESPNQQLKEIVNWNYFEQMKNNFFKSNDHSNALKLWNFFILNEKINQYDNYSRVAKPTFAQAEI